MKRQIRGLLVLSMGVVLLESSVAWGQVIIDTFPALDNVSANSLRARAPGNMVQAGVARAKQVARPDIVNTEVPPSIKAIFLAEAIDIIFDDINNALLLVINLFRARAGIEPYIPGFENLPDDVITDEGDVSLEGINLEDIGSLLEGFNGGS